MALVGYADHGGEADVRVREQDLLDLARIDVEAAAQDHVLGPVDDVVEAVGVLAGQVAGAEPAVVDRSEEHTSELQSLMRISYAVFCLKKKKNKETKREHIRT